MTVLDASAVLALVFGEPGAARVAAALDGALISTVNVTEVLTRMIDRGDDPNLALRDLTALELAVIPFDHEQAALAARLRTGTRAAGLSLGDRACLALALTRGRRALTTDRAWERADIGVEVDFAR